MKLKSATMVMAASMLLLTESPLLALDVDLKAVGHYATTEWRYGLPISTNFTYIREPDSWQVIDVSDRMHPKPVGPYNTLASLFGVAISGNFAYVPAGQAGLEVIDISDPANPSRVAAYDTPGYARSVVVAGNYAYVADGLQWIGAKLVASLQVINISEPARPQLAGSYIVEGEDSEFAGGAESVAISGNYVYLAVQPRHTGTNYVGALLVIDITNPANPRRVASYDTSGCFWLSSVVIAGNRAYLGYSSWGCGGLDDVTSSSGRYIIDITEPANPRLIGNIEGNSDYPPFVAFSRTHMYVAELTTLKAWDINNPTNAAAASLRINANTRALAVSGNYAYVATDVGLQVVILSAVNPQRLRELTELTAYDIAVAGNHAYIASSTNGLKVIEVSHPANAQLIGRCHLGGSAVHVAVSGTYAYVADGDAGLHVVDVSNTADPQRVGFFDTGVWPLGVAVSGNYVYVAAQQRDSNYHFASFSVIDVSNPANPRRVGDYPLGGGEVSSWGVAVSGNYAYVADGTTGLQVLDVSNPANPVCVGKFDPFDYSAEFEGVIDLAVSGNHAYVTIRTSNPLGHVNVALVVVDLSNPANPQPVGYYPGIAGHVAVSGNYAYVLDWSADLHVLDVSNPVNPARVGRNNPGLNPGLGVGAVTVANGKVFVAAREQGLIILHEYQPIRFEQIARQDGGDVRLRIAGPPSVPGRVQRSADTRAWTDWLPVEFGESIIELSDPDARTAPASFYRIVVP